MLWGTTTLGPVQQKGPGRKTEKEEKNTQEIQEGSWVREVRTEGRFKKGMQRMLYKG